MAATTVTEFKTLPCSRCCGRGFISSFQYKNGGECFRCGASGIDPQMNAVERDMTDDEVIAELAKFGFEVMLTEREIDVNDVSSLFLTDEEVSAREQAMAGARMMLAAL